VSKAYNNNNNNAPVGPGPGAKPGERSYVSI